MPKKLAGGTVNVGWNHAPQYCHFLRETCYKWQQVGHTTAACHAQSTRQNQVNPRGGRPGVQRPASRFTRADQSNRFRHQEQRRSATGGGFSGRRVHFTEQEDTRMLEITRPEFPVLLRGGKFLKGKCCRCGSNSFR